MNYLFYLFIGIAFMPYCLNAQTKYVETRTILGAEVQVFRLPKGDKKFGKNKYFRLTRLQDDLVSIEKDVSQNSKESWRYKDLFSNQRFQDEIRILKKEHGQKFPFALWEAEWQLYDNYFSKKRTEALEKMEAESIARAQALAERARSLCNHPLYDTLRSYDLETIAQTLDNSYLKDSTELRLCMTNKKKANEDAHKQRAENSRSYLEQEAKNAEKAARQAELNRLSDDDLHKISTGKSTNTRINSANALDEIRERETARRRSSSSSTRRSTKSRSR